MQKPNPLKTKLYDRKNFSIQLTEEGKKHILDQKLIKELKNCEYLCLPEASGEFVIFNNKKTFIKKTSALQEAHQLKDYIEQSKLINNIPKIYGYAKIHNQQKLYVASELISDALPLIEVFKYKDKILNQRLRTEIENIGNKLIEKNKLPWDFKIRQFFISKHSKNLYFSDNTINMSVPIKLVELYKACKLKVPFKLKLLETAFNAHPVALIRKITRKALKVDNGVPIDNVISNKSRFLPLKARLIARHLKDMNLILIETSKFYEGLPSSTKTKLQRKILDNCLKSFDSLSNNI